MVNITRPVGMRLLDWADQVCLDLDFSGPVGKLDFEENWQNWGAQFFNNASLGRNIPNPYEFTDWKNWAERFCQSLQ